VPEYDPWLIYGDPLAFYPGWIGVPGFFLDGLGIGFGVGIGIGLYGGFGWGWHSWETDWHRDHLIHGDHPYFSQSREFGDHGGFGHGRAGFDHSLLPQVEGESKPVSFHGYSFRILSIAGGGFAAIAYPTMYRASGVMTFIVAQEGGVLEKDFGPNTANIALAMTRYHSDATWTPGESNSQ
jgi:hypothetical protein